jgi:predicted DCC family thiol-disulfide oxidoreductase YuxK
MLQCGTCGLIGQTCGGGGQPNVCGTPDYGVDTACTRDGVCFLNPRPVSHDFKDVWGRSVEDFWAVGNAGFIVHGGPGGLSVLPSEAELSGVWGSAPEDVWAVGSEVLRFDGRRWSPVMRPERFLLDVYGTGAGNVWAVGEAGVAYAWNGTRWERQNLGTSADLYGVWAYGDVVWAVGTGSTIRVRDERGWRSLTPPEPGLTFTGVWGNGPEDVWVTSERKGDALFHWNGRAWSPVRLPFSALYGISGRSSSDILVVGEEGAAHYNGSIWSVTVNGSPSRLLGAWHAPDGKLVVGAAGRVQRTARDGTWRVLDQGARADFISLSVPEEDRWWLGDGSNLWVGPNFAGPVAGPGNAFAGQAPGRLWAAGDYGRVDLRSWDAHGGGTNFFYLPQTFHFRGVYPLKDMQAWLVGVDVNSGGGLVILLDGHTSWTPYPLSTPGAMNAIHGTSPEDVWAVGDAVIAHWNGMAWTEMHEPRMPAFRAVQAVSRDQAWAISAQELWHWNGTHWAPVSLPPDAQRAELRALLASPRGELYLAGDRGLLLRYDTSRRTWHRLETGTRKSLRALSGGSRTLVIAGEDGTVLKLSL